MAKIADITSPVGWAAVFCGLLLSSPAWGDPLPDGGAAATAASDAPDKLPVQFEAHYPRGRAFPLREWLKRQSLKGPSSERDCWELVGVVGEPPVDGVLCVKDDRQKSVRWARVYRAEAGRLRLVFDAIVATWANWLELTPVLASDGTLWLHDRTETACYDAIIQYREKLESQAPPPGGERLEEACGRVGKYRYEGGRYRMSEPHVRPPMFWDRQGVFFDPP